MPSTGLASLKVGNREAGIPPLLKSPAIYSASGSIPSSSEELCVIWNEARNQPPHDEQQSADGPGPREAKLCVATGIGSYQASQTTTYRLNSDNDIGTNTTTAIEIDVTKLPGKGRSRWHVTIRQGADVLHLDTIDIESTRSRNAFLNQVVKRAEAQGAKFERERCESILMQHAAIARRATVPPLEDLQRAGALPGPPGVRRRGTGRERRPEHRMLGAEHRQAMEDQEPSQLEDGGDAASRRPAGS